MNNINYDYENSISKDYIIYKDIYELLEMNPNIKTDNNIIIYLINWPAGFGSALIIFLVNALYLNNINNKLIIFPYYCINTNNFKYHEK